MSRERRDTVELSKSLMASIRKMGRLASELDDKWREIERQCEEEKQAADQRIRNQLAQMGGNHGVF